MHHGPRSECGDRGKSWYPQRVVCWAEMQHKGAEELYAKLHEERPYHDGTFASWSENRSVSHPFHYGEGVSIVVAETDIQPWDDFLTNPKASPVRPSQPGD